MKEEINNLIFKIVCFCDTNMRDYPNLVYVKNNLSTFYEPFNSISFTKSGLILESGLEELDELLTKLEELTAIVKIIRVQLATETRTFYVNTPPEETKKYIKFGDVTIFKKHIHLLEEIKVKNHESYYPEMKLPIYKNLKTKYIPQGR